jgi:hypothetical protein
MEIILKQTTEDGERTTLVAVAQLPSKNNFFR